MTTSILTPGTSTSTLDLLRGPQRGGLVFPAELGKITGNPVSAVEEIEVASGEPVATPTAEVPQLPNHKVKVKKPGQRACNEKDAKGKFCGGHLKRWFYTTDVLERECGCAEKAWGSDAEVYRCEFCKTLYLPNSEDARGVNVGGVGQLSVFGITVAPKEEKKA